MAKINPAYPTLDYLNINGVNGLLNQATFEGVPPVVASTFEVGCVTQDVINGDIYANTGTVAVPVWTAL